MKSSWVLGGFLVLGGSILLLSLVDGPFSPTKVGTGGEWFAGIAGAAVLAWAVGEETRHKARRARQRSEAAAERAVRAIVKSGIRPGDLEVKVAERARALYEALEVERQVIDSSEVSERMRATTVALMLGWHKDEELLADGFPRARLDHDVRQMAEECNGTLLAYWREDSLPEWTWPGYGELGAWLRERYRAESQGTPS